MTNTINTKRLFELTNHFDSYIKDYLSFKEVLETHKRKAFLPLVTEQKLSFTSISKIGGAPFLRSQDDWPVCPTCGNHQDLFLQLDLSRTPNYKGTGLLQLFYCTSKETVCTSKIFLPFSAQKTIRIISPIGDSVKMKPNTGKAFKEKRIIGWEAIYEYPHFEEYDHLGIKGIDDGMLDNLHSADIALPLKKDKLFGWPYWEQEMEYPKDRRTDKQMLNIFQFGSYDHLNFNFGDGGQGHLCQSTDNNEELSFSWS